MQYVGAFHSVVCGSDGAAAAIDPVTHQAVFNAETSVLRPVAGVRPAMGLSRPKQRAGSLRNGGYLCNPMFQWYLGLMMAIEFGTFDVQTAFTFGFGFDTTPAAYLRATGRTAVLGNANGVIMADDATPSGADYDLVNVWPVGWPGKVVACSYRGIENPYCSWWTIFDGCQFGQDTVQADYTRSGFWITNATSLYGGCDAPLGTGTAGSTVPPGGTGAQYAWVHQAWPKREDDDESDWYVTAFDPLTFYASAVGGSSETYLCDYLYAKLRTSTTETLLAGGGGIAHTRGAFAQSTKIGCDDDYEYGLARICC